MEYVYRIVFFPGVKVVFSNKTLKNAGGKVNPGKYDTVVIWVIIPIYSNSKMCLYMLSLNFLFQTIQTIYQCIVYCTILCCTVLHCIMPYINKCTVLYCILLYSNIIQYTTLYWIFLYWPYLYCIIIYFTSGTYSKIF